MTTGLYAVVPVVATFFSVIIGFYFIRRFASGGVCKSKTRLDGKTVIITGANSGIGRETALELARRGGRIILACRDVVKGEKVASEIKAETGSDNLVVQRLDLSSFDSVRQFVDRVVAQESRLDILINNAGGAVAEGKTVDGIEINFQANHLSHFLLTLLLLDLLKKSTPSRVINVSSMVHDMAEINFDNINLEGCFTGFKAYKQSKLANLLFSRELGRRLAGTGVVVMSLHPGAVSTEVFRNMRFPMLQMVHLSLYFFGKTARQGAQTSIHCALLEPTEEMIAGRAFYFKDCQVAEEAPQAKDDESARRLWQISEEMVGLK